jgi:hypothetical protein
MTTTQVPWKKWFKLVGVTGGAVPDNWVEEEASLIELMRFPKHRQPSNISNYEGLIAYAVGKKKIFAAQRRAGAVRINPPIGPKGSVTFRWPHEMDVETFAWVPDLTTAPSPDEAVPGFMEKYGRQSWNGSHWKITDEEFAALEAAILDRGVGKAVASPPWIAEKPRELGA